MGQAEGSAACEQVMVQCSGRLYGLPLQPQVAFWSRLHLSGLMQGQFKCDLSKPNYGLRIFWGWVGLRAYALLSSNRQPGAAAMVPLCSVAVMIS